MPANFEVVVRQRRQDAQQIVVLELASLDGSPLPAWSPGAHIDVQAQDDSGRVVQRQYSLCGRSEESGWTIAVLDAQDGRGGARWLHREARVGSQLRVSMPRNNFRLHDGLTRTVLIAGGIGITPILAMARELHAREAPFSLHYFARSRQRAAFVDELTHGNLASHSRISFDNQRQQSPQEFQEAFSGVDPAAQVYVCGPLRFMEAVTEQARSRGIAPENIHRELFAADSNSASENADSGFEIELRSSGKIIHVSEASTAVKALEAAGIEVIVSCEQGLCGSCLTGVLEGIPDHRDQFLMPEEQARNDCFTPCCSRALTPRLVLDL